MSALAAPSPTDEALYQQTLQELKSPRPAPATSLLFVVLLLVFVAASFGQLRSVSGVVVLIAVLTLHEAGHALGMRAFGFRDVKMFFLPFFGAVVSGRARGASAWKEATVSLLGPLPGILLGVVLLVLTMRQQHPSALQFHVAEMLLVLNAFNLLPFGFLDGGHFLERVLFSRHRVLEVAFQAIGSLLLVFIAFKLSMYLLALFSALSLMGLRRRWRALTAAASLRKQHPALGPDPDQLREPEGRAMFAAAQQVVDYPASERSLDVARTMESILLAMKRAPGALATLGLLVLYGFALFCVLVGIVLMSGLTGSVNWQAVQHSGWRAEFPRAPLAVPVPASPAGHAYTEWHTVVDGTERFTIWVMDLNDGAEWMTATAARLAEETGTKLTRTRPIDMTGHSGFEFELTAPNRVVRARMAASGARRFQVIASAPRWGENQRRFQESFTILDSLPGR